MKEKACRTCRYIDVPPDSLGRRIPRKGYAYPCTVPNPCIEYPLCITSHFEFESPPPRALVIPEWTGCPYHEEKR